MDPINEEQGFTEGQAATDADATNASHAEAGAAPQDAASTDANAEAVNGEASAAEEAPAKAPRRRATTRATTAGTAKPATRTRKTAAQKAAEAAAAAAESAAGSAEEVAPEVAGEGPVAAAEVAAAAEAAATESAAAESGEAAEVPAKATRRRATTRATTAGTAKPATRTRKTAAQKAAEAAEAAAVAAAGPADEVATEAAAEPAAAESGEAESGEAVEAPAKTTRRRAATRTAASRATTATTRTPATRTRKTAAQKAAEAAEAAAAAESATGSVAEGAVEVAPTEAAPLEAAQVEVGAVEATEATPVGEAVEAAPAEAAVAPAAAAEETAAASPAANPFALPVDPLSVLFHAPDLTAIPARAAEPEEEQEEAGEEDEGRSRSRRARRARGRARVEGAEAETEGADEAAEAPLVGEDGVVSRRRRRRRRGDADLELTGGHDDDPPNTITRVRAPRPSNGTEAVPSNKVASVKGSTRLEAKRQRRRESRESGRRRQVITEAEFLARRESVDRQMIVRQREDRIQIAVLEDGILGEHFVSKTQQDSLIGNVYVGKVQNVLPSMEAAFVDIGRGRNAVLYAGEVNWDVAGLDGQPRRIEHALKSGDSVLVQVTKDPIGHKGARLTSQISLPGRYLVYVPGGSMTGISRKLPDVERNRLKKILKDHLPENAGVIVRTAAEGASEEELMNDINRLRAQWEEIDRKSTSTKTLPPELLYGEPDLTIKVVRDVFNEDFSKLIVSGDEAWDTIEAYVTYVAPDLVSRLEKWEGEEDIFAANRIDEQIHKALERKVFLPSGGSLVIDRTEAMTVVDVNTGKFTGSGGNLEETVTKNNLEAAEEIVRQLRLRDIGGIIVIDFIDMVLESNRDLVLRRLVECLGRDRTKHQVAEVTSLGLVQMTRKRMGTGLLEVFSENCEACNGRGVITHDEPVEHRRSFTSHGEPQAAPRIDRTDRTTASRSERRKRSRGPEKEQEAVVAHLPEAPEAAKASAARAAFATIAAAAHAAHEHELELERGESVHAAADAALAAIVQGAAASGHAPEERADDGVVGEGAAGGAEQVLTIAGEEVPLPRSRRRRRASAPVQTPDLTLESLTAAFAEVPSVPAVQSVPPAQSVPAAAQAPEAIEEEVPQGAASGEALIGGTLTGEAPSGEGRSRRRRRGRASAPAMAPAAAGQAQVSAPEQAEAPAEVPAATPVASAEPVAPARPAAERAAEPAPADQLQAGEGTRARRARRPRAARSAQGSANEPIQRSEAVAGAGQGSTHVAKLPATAPAAAPAAPAAEPMILGVGVPASEL
ncbi:hypothetical protein GCM10023081_24700 [Arthrobacter ginkgonis]|uniref:S1 motif domain-containing protein n=1 Tax=Arthrobacter ginkgonis TaxID=1630594 RepID=A0ABP7CBJ0_9MICC